MKLTNKEQQPYRIWFEYLKTTLNDEQYSKKINKEYYKDWHLSLVKKQKFNQWLKSHEHLFVDTNKSEIRLYEGKRTPNTILVEIPVSFNVQKIQREIGKVVKGKIAKSQINQKFKIQTNRPLQTAPLEYFLWAYEFKKTTNLKLEDIWNKVDQKIKDRQTKVAKQVERFTKTGEGIRKRALASGGFSRVDKNKAILISRNIKKAQNILLNVCKGNFPGNYSDH